MPWSIDAASFRDLKDAARDMRRAAEEVDIASEMIEGMLENLASAESRIVAAIKPAAADGVEIAAVWHEEQALLADRLAEKQAHEAERSFGPRMIELHEKKAAQTQAQARWHRACAEALRGIKNQLRLPLNDDPRGNL